MKKITLVSLLVLIASSAFAFDTSQPVTATAITSLPFTISSPGNYYLPTDLNFTGAGVAILINASGVVLDLNGRSINAIGSAHSPGVGIGVAVVNREDVIIQNGNINGFGAYGILLDANNSDRDQKNDIRNINFNKDLYGVLIVSGSIDEVEHCNFDGGSIGVYDIASLGGDRIQACNFENQTAVEILNASYGVISTPGGGVLIEDCEFAHENNAGFVEQGATDKYRFNSFVGGGPTHFGGTEEGAGDL
jgi:hypothetical protein